MFRKTLFLSTFILIAILTLAACGGEAPDPTNTPPPPTVVLAPTNTSIPASVPDPTDTPEPAPTPQSVEPAADTETSPLPTPQTAILCAFDIDAESSEVSYEAREEFFNGAVERLGKILGFFNAVGATNAIVGGLVLTEGNPPRIETSRFEVDLRTLKSDDDRRDQRIREKFLESDQFPRAEFTATGVENFPQGYEAGEAFTFQLAGDMTIHETTRPAVWDVTATLDGDSISGTAQTVVMMADYGIETPVIPGILTVTDGITVTVKFRAVEVMP